MAKHPRDPNRLAKLIVDIATAIHLLHFNFARIRKTPRITPALAAGLADRVWGLEEIILLVN